MLRLENAFDKIETWFLFHLKAEILVLTLFLRQSHNNFKHNLIHFERKLQGLTF